MTRLLDLIEPESQDFKESLNHRRLDCPDSGVDDLTIEKLSEIPGVGEKVQQALIEHFGSETVALKVKDSTILFRNGTIFSFRTNNDILPASSLDKSNNCPINCN